MSSAFGMGAESGNGTNGTNGTTTRTVNGDQGTVNGGKQNGLNGTHDEDSLMEGVENEKPLPSIDLTRTRTYSPPPQLPDFIGGGGGLGGEDIFKDIH